MSKFKFPKFDERVWYRQFRCPSCGRKSIVTNVCRGCAETPADHPLRYPEYCYTHRTFHVDENGNPVGHRYVNMVATGWASRFNPLLGRGGRNERRKIKNLPKDAILRS